MCKFQGDVFRSLREVHSSNLTRMKQAIFYVFDLSKCTKTCNTAVVFEEALDVKSVKPKEKP